VYTWSIDRWSCSLLVVIPELQCSCQLVTRTPSLEAPNPSTALHFHRALINLSSILAICCGSSSSKASSLIRSVARPDPHHDLHRHPFAPPSMCSRRSCRQASQWCPAFNPGCGFLPILPLHPFRFSSNLSLLFSSPLQLFQQSIHFFKSIEIFRIFSSKHVSH
jgi:hypothetical protein